MKRMRIFALAAALSLAVLVTAAVLVYHRPPLRLTSDSRGIHVDVQTLGEYFTEVARVLLVDRSVGTLVWELRSNGSRQQLSTFGLHVGVNPLMPSDLDQGSFEVVTPNRAKSFRIERGHLYTLEIRGTSLSLTRHRTEFLVEESLPSAGRLRQV